MASYPHRWSTPRASGLHSPLGRGGGGSSGCASARPATAVAAAPLPACSRPAPDRLHFTSTPSPAARAQCPALTRKQLSRDPQQQHVTPPHVSRPLRDWEGPEERSLLERAAVAMATGKGGIHLEWIRTHLLAFLTSAPGEQPQVQRPITYKRSIHGERSPGRTCPNTPAILA